MRSGQTRAGVQFLRLLSTSNLSPQHVAIADMLLSDTSMSPTTTCCLNMSPKIQFYQQLEIRPQKKKKNYYLFKIGAVDSPMCDLCLLSDTVEHMLVECFKHTTLHIELKLICKAINKPYNVTTLLSNNLLFNVIFLYISVNNISI